LVSVLKLFQISCFCTYIDIWRVVHLFLDSSRLKNSCSSFEAVLLRTSPKRRCIEAGLYSVSSVARAHIHQPIRACALTHTYTSNNSIMKLVYKQNHMKILFAFLLIFGASTTRSCRNMHPLLMRCLHGRLLACNCWRTSGRNFVTRVDLFQFWLKWNSNNGHFAWRSSYVSVRSLSVLRA
jgi:hypothetical protein